MKVSPIRVAQPADLLRLVELVRQYWQFEAIRGFDAERVSTLLKRVLLHPNLGTIWVASADDQLVGYLLAVYVFSLEQQGLMAEIDEFFVAPAARAVGIGTALLDAAETGLAQRGCVCLQLQLGKENSSARAFYRRRGYSARDGYDLYDKRLGG